MIYKQKKEIIAMLLAGGQGSRLGPLTKDVAKPAVSFGGKYRVIDFTLSNCVNSNMDTVGVLTQYQPLELNAYIGNGQPWDLARLYGGVSVLPPYVRGDTGEWYKGTANAIFQNMKFIDMYKPTYILILSGDHIYKMNYELMLEEHKRKNADCTIAVLEVPLEEASRFGVMNADHEGKIYEFEEKPPKPKSNLASMGVYIFSWEKLKEHLILDEKDTKSSNDFGKNIIPNMLASNQNMFAYKFSGYWKDVGTIESLWEANMDLLNPNVPIQIDDKLWKIYARTPGLTSQYVGPTGSLRNSMMTEGCVVNGNVENSIISPAVHIEEGAVVKNSVIMPGVKIKSGAKIEYSIVGEEAIISNNAVIGECQDGVSSADLQITLIGGNITIGEGKKVKRGKMIDEDIF